MNTANKRIAFTFWAGPQLSLLNVMSLLSFAILNPHVELIIYNVLGKEVRVLVKSRQEAGTYNINFDASNLASGIYMYKLKAVSKETGKKFLQSKKMVLLK